MNQNSKYPDIYKNYKFTKDKSNLLINIKLYDKKKHMYIFYDVSFRFYHVRCLNILQFGHRFHFWCRKKNCCILTDMLFSRSILTIFDQPFYIARDRAPVSARMIPNV